MKAKEIFMIVAIGAVFFALAGCSDTATNLKKSCEVKSDCGICGYCNMGECKIDSLCRICSSDEQCYNGEYCDFSSGGECVRKASTDGDADAAAEVQQDEEMADEQTAEDIEVYDEEFAELEIEAEINAEPELELEPEVEPELDSEVEEEYLPLFSFFVTSYKAIIQLSGSQNGFGGDLRFGETGTGAGLRGADKICETIAEMSMPGSKVKVWRAFLSATNDGNGNVVNAIDRIGNGPWYDRYGRVFALKKADLLYDRPSSADAAIKNDFPNEDGVTNHRPDLTQPQVDNHDMLTGSNDQGKLYSSTATCKDWTTSNGSSSNGRPRVGHSWPRSGGPGGGSSGESAPPGGDDMANWMSALDEGGCAAGVNLVETGGPNSNTVGSGGGYGGFYCFALTP